MVEGQPRPEYAVSLQNKSLAIKATWPTKTAQKDERRTNAQLDHDVGVTLARQWAHQQADSRRNGENALERASGPSMDWKGRLAPGPFGARLLLMTLLGWGSGLYQNTGSERAEWERLARDFGDVFSLLAAQAGPCDGPMIEPSAAHDEPRKRMK